QVVLHLADDSAELRQVAAQHVVLFHGGQGLVQRMGRAHQFHEQTGDCQVGPEGIVDQVSVGTKGADGCRPNALYFRVLGHQYKDFHDGVGCVCENLIVDGFDVKIAHLEAFVQRADFVFAAAANNRFVIELKDDVG